MFTKNLAFARSIADSGVSPIYPVNFSYALVSHEYPVHISEVNFEDTRCTTILDTDTSGTHP